jgi:hypothetical protein
MEGCNWSELSLPTAASPPNIGLLVELDRQDPEEISRLKRGDGPLARQIQTAVTSLSEGLGIEAGAQVIPVILLYRQAKSDYVVIAARTQGGPRSI